MSLRDEDPFVILENYGKELKRIVNLEKTIKASHLLDVRRHMKICDRITQTNMQKVILFTTHHYWLECRKRWLKNNPDANVNKIIPTIELRTEQFHTKSPTMALTIITKSNKPRQSWEECLTKDDEKFLKDFYAGNLPEAPSQDGEDDSSDDGA